MNNYEKRTNKKKEAIIYSALELFGKEGFTDVSIKDIAALAQVSQVSIYNYFGSKEAVVAECAKVIMKETIELAEKILASQEMFTQKLKHALLLCNRNMNVSLNQYLSKKASNDSQFQRLLAKNMNTLKKQIYMKYIAEGKRENVIDNRISDEAIQLFIEAINTLGVTMLEEELLAKQEELIHLFLYGLIGQGAEVIK